MMSGHVMKSVLRQLLAVLIYLGMCHTCATCVCAGETYHVDAVKGQDASSGLGPDQ